jgi:hypothetical protein
MPLLSLCSSQHANTSSLAHHPPLIPLPLFPCAPICTQGISATAIACGGYHTCVLVSGGAVKCWGWNDYGQLGIGSTAQKNSPVDVGLGSGKQGALLSAPTSYGVGGGGFIHWHQILRSLMGWCGQSVRTLFWGSLH